MFLALVIQKVVILIRDLMTSIFGSYTPVLTAVYDSDGTYLGDVVASGFAGVDWEYILGVFLFGIVLYCVLRIFEAVIRSL